MLCFSASATYVAKCYKSLLKPRSHALIYTRYVNYTYMYNLHPGVKIYLLRVHMLLKSFRPFRG